MVPVISNDIFRINENVTSSTFSGSQPVGNVSASSSKHSFPSDRNVTSISSSSQTVGITDIMFVQVGQKHEIEALTERVDGTEKHILGLTSHIALLQKEHNKLREDINFLIEKNDELTEENRKLKFSLNTTNDSCRLVFQEFAVRRENRKRNKVYDELDNQVEFLKKRTASS